MAEQIVLVISSSTPAAKRLIEEKREKQMIIDVCPGRMTIKSEDGTEKGNGKLRRQSIILLNTGHLIITHLATGRLLNQLERALGEDS